MGCGQWAQDQGQKYCLTMIRVAKRVALFPSWPAGLTGLGGGGKEGEASSPRVDFAVSCMLQIAAAASLYS